MIVFVASALLSYRKKLPSHAKAHLILQILADGNTITQPLPPPRLEHQIPCQTLSLCRLERAELDRRIGRVSRYDRPVIKAHLTECLAHRRGPEIRLEPVRVEDGNKGLDGVEGRAGLGGVARDVSAAPGEDGVDGGDAVGGGLDFDKEDGLEETGCGLDVS